jgi:hydrogenase expression/formation protein HypC
MCLAIPVCVVAVHEDEWADVDLGGVVTRISIALVGGVTIGDYLIVHAGFAITRLNVEEAEKTLALFEEIASHLRGRPDALHSRLS